MEPPDNPNFGNHTTSASLNNGSKTGDGSQTPHPESKPPPRESITDDVENRPPNPPLDVISASSNEQSNHLIGHVDADPLVMEVDIAMEESQSNEINSQRSAPPRSFVPGPLREEPTLKEILVDRERQRRKEAERARLKRQFALSDNGGGLVYETAGGGGGASITGTVGEESTHADMEDSISGLMHSHNHHHNQGGDTSPPLGYTMERFLQETATTSSARNNAAQAGAVAVATAIASSTNASNVIREEAIEGDPKTAGAPDKGVVMERFLNEPVVVDAAPPPTTANLREHTQISNRADDVHRSVSFDMELRTSHSNIPTHREDRDRPPENNHQARSDTTDDHLHLSIDDSNASVRVEVATEDDILGPVSPGGRLSVPSEVAPSSLETDDHHHHHRQPSEMETSLGSVGPSIDRQSISSNVNNESGGDDDTADEPRVLRLTEAEIQEMAAIEEASIGNAPPSDRDAESLVGDLVGTFGTPNAGEAGTNFSQETPTTAMESGSMLSGNPLSAPRSTAMTGDQPQSANGRDMDQNSIDDMAMSASVSSHLVVSPGASVSGSVSVAANPPSEITGRGETTTMLEVDDDGHEPVPPPPSSVVVESTSEIQALASPPMSVAAAESEDERNHDAILAAQPSQARLPSSSVPAMMGESRSSVAIREELKASSGPPAEEIVNRRLRPGMVESAAAVPISPQPGVASFPDNANRNRNSIVDTPKTNRTVDEFDFDKDMPMTPRSLMSDSLRDLPGDDEWTSPGTKMTVSPIHRSRDALKHNRGRDPKLEPFLAVPSMTAYSPSAENKDGLKASETDQKESSALISRLECAFNDIRANNSTTVEAKESELYSRGSIQSNALQKRLLPLLVTFITAVPALRMISQNEKLCTVLGRQHHQLLLGFLPIIAAISGNTSAQASSLTTTAICHGHVTAQSYKNWIKKECKVATLLGLGVGATVGALAFFVTSASITKETVAFAVAVGIAVCINSTTAGITGSNFPVLLCLVFKEKGANMGGLVERALADLISTFLAMSISYCILLVSLASVDPVDACMT